MLENTLDNFIGTVKSWVSAIGTPISSNDINVHTPTLTPTPTPTLTLPPKTELHTISKSYIYSYLATSYVCIKDKNLIDLGYTLPDDTISANDSDHVGKFILVIVRQAGSTNFKFADSSDVNEVHSEALDLAENERNNIIRVGVGVGVPLMFANRPVFRLFTSYIYANKSVDVDIESETVRERVSYDSIEDFDTIHKSQGTSSLQSIIFPKSKFSIEQAKTWLKEHGKHSDKVDTTKNYHRFRQFDPSECSTTPKTISLGDSGIKGIVCAKMKKEENTEVKRDITIKGYNLSRGLVYGIVYSPSVIDTQGDYTSAEEIERAAHNFLPNAAMNVHHKDDVQDVEVVESYIAPTDFDLNGERVSKGSWILVSRVNDEELRKSIASGEITGYSLEGTCVRV